MIKDVPVGIDTAEFDSFQRTFVDLAQPDYSERLTQVLNEYGFATFDGLTSPDDLLPIANQFGQIIIHRDSDEKGITTIAPREDASYLSGHAGFSNKELYLHTDGTVMTEPASFLLIYCSQPAESGGESLLLDGKRLHDELVRINPGLLEALSSPGSAIFGPIDSQRVGSVIEDWNGLKTMRFRFDDLGFYSASIARQLPEFLSIMDRLQTKFRAKKGQGYIVNNRRSLHGRTSFTGHREMFRVLVNANPNSPIGGNVELGFFQSKFHNKF